MISAYELKFYFMAFYMISNEMMSDLYILSSRMMNRIFTKIDGISIITMNGDVI